MARHRKAQPMYNPNIEYITNVTPKGETYVENAYKHIKYVYWMQFITLILIIFVILYVYLKGLPVKVR